MSEQPEFVRRWELPSFETIAVPEPPVDLAAEAAMARQRGFDQGRVEGRQQGLAEAREVMQRAQLLLDELARPYRNLDQVVSQELARTAMSIATQIVRRELSIDSSAVGGAVSEALATLSSIEGEVAIYLHPADLQQISELGSELLEGHAWKLEEDSDMLPGGCRVKTPISYVDASMERQIEMMMGTLLAACEESSGP
ncbi:MAG: hypothetical protein KDI01_06690 [Halioglobus sp.]|nr:hypothetical protein [Halioglobus sp.]